MAPESSSENYPHGGSPAGVQQISSNKSAHAELRFLINPISHARFHFLSAFSLLMALPRLMDFVPNQPGNLITFCKSFHAVILVLRYPLDEVSRYANMQVPFGWLARMYTHGIFIRESLHV